MTRRRSVPTTPAANLQSSSISWHKPDHKPEPSQSQTSADSSLTTRHYERVGLCGICLQPIEALQPGGLAIRHIDDQRPYCGGKKS